MDNQLFLGVDGGATNCRVAILDHQGFRQAEAHGGPANIANNYYEARENILKAVAQALRQIGKNEADFEKLSAVLGVAGNNLGDYGQRLENDLPFFEQTVLNDSHISTVGALGDRLGVVAALGTGSVFARQDEQGVHMLGGWGFLLGDEGSGAKLGYHLFERVIYAEDGLYEHSDLTRNILGEFGGRLGVLVEAAKAMAPHEFGHYAPQVLHHEKLKDRNAVDIVQQAVHWIERQIDAVGFQPDRALCLLGGLGPIFRPKLAEKYQKAIVQANGNALDGAGQLAIAYYKK